VRVSRATPAGGRGIQEIAPPASPRQPGWTRQYARRLLATDLLVILATILGSQLLWFGVDSQRLRINGGSAPFEPNYWLVSLVLVAGWLVVLVVYDTRDPRVIGIGPMEYKRVLDAGMLLFGVAAIVALLFRFEPARGYVITAFPLGVVLLVLSRWAWRQKLVRERVAGRSSSSVLVVGSGTSVGYLLEQFKRFPAAGYLPVAACLAEPADGQMPKKVHGIPVVGELDDVADVAKSLGVDIVMLTSSDHLPPSVVRNISWSLEASGIDVAVAPALTAIAGPRIHTRPVAGLPVLHVEVPRYEGWKRVLKAVFDWSAAAIAVTLLSPVLLVLALLVAADSRGPIFFHQERVGLNGRVFRMHKFRSMGVDAEERRKELEDSNEAAGPLFKMKDDPRVTRVGRWMRRYSMDELPQLFNVLAGEMSMVGPRPPLVEEAAKYEPTVRRRLLVKPGITGPWQISGRSDLSWDEGVRLDLYYVENWSLANDLILLVRTVGAVVLNRGAY
jgi:exopolysaccharide biosynthesis polyprenyl glycosylphosphotransferase